ncbi:hypothetical protein SB49_03185 [Sediminicola sp. YIK13]|uniref:hypothetical protein n=1 Tax=Sediminicola sp. YIK13 TaxID=1453352 RepID=UPI000721DEC9|nr:hypothetical protein [Sediminicola sp. YIK13]ALM06915.1 hypothetical protein SB49_03185 [Sediminicola sp. YIK13]
MNTIQVISIFICGFALGLILFILLEKLFEPEVDFDELNDLYLVQDNKSESNKTRIQDSRISAKQNFIGDSLGFSNGTRFRNEKASTTNLKSKVIELRNRNKVAF